MPIVLYKKTIKSFQFYLKNKCIKKKAVFMLKKIHRIFIRLAFKKHLMYFFTGCKRQNIGILCPCNQMFQCCDISGNGFPVKAQKCGSRISILFYGGQVIASCIKDCKSMIAVVESLQDKITGLFIICLREHFILL